VALIGVGCSIVVAALILAAPIHVAGPRWSDAAGLFVLTTHSTLLGAATAFVMLYCLYPVNRLGRLLEVLLSWKPLYSIAQLAYSAYLLHPIVLTIFYTSISPNLSRYPMIVYFIAGPVLSFAAAAGLYLFIERPFMNLRDYRFNRGQIGTRRADATVSARA
jgi:peptidoglycan/LPS O-acetylase OafA/YrhL